MKHFMSVIATAVILVLNVGFLGCEQGSPTSVQNTTADGDLEITSLDKRGKKHHKGKKEKKDHDKGHKDDKGEKGHGKGHDKDGKEEKDHDDDDDEASFFTVSGTVYDDADNSSDMESGEAGIAGVIVDLKDDDGTIIATATTDVNGMYVFENIEDDDEYSIRVAVGPEGSTATENAGGYQIDDPAGDLTGVDFGYYTLVPNPTYSISGSISYDGDCTLRIFVRVDGTFISTEVRPDGSYSLSGLPAGETYAIVADAPEVLPFQSYSVTVFLDQDLYDVNFTFECGSVPPPPPPPPPPSVPPTGF